VRKDVQQFRWLLAAFAALLLAATVGAASRERLLDGNLQWAAGLLLILGPIIAASLVQADSPTRADAFWASHPFRRWSMLGAKVTLVLVLLLVTPLVGQLLGLIAFEVPASELPMIMLASSVWYGLALLVALFIGALTRELRGFILGLIAFFVAIVAISILAEELRWSWNPVLRVVLQTLALGGIVALFVILYVRRDTRSARAAGVASLALLLIASVNPIGQAAPNSTPAGLLRPKTMAGVALELRDTSQITRTGQAQFRLRLVHGVDGLHYRLDDMHARFFLRGGATLDVPARQLIAHTITPVLATGSLTLPEVPTIRATEESFVSSATDLTVDLDSDQRTTLAQGVDSAELIANVVVFEPRVLTVLPLRAGAHSLDNGYDVRIEQVALGSSSDLVEVAVRTVAGAAGEYAWLDNTNGFFAILVDSNKTEAIGLARSRASANPGLLVLPGAGLRQGSVMFRKPHVMRGQAPVQTDAFRQGASLLLVQWQPAAQYRARATSVPLPPSDFVRRGRQALGGSAIDH
jgi:hypothetical protein